MDGRQHTHSLAILIFVSSVKNAFANCSPSSHPPSAQAQPHHSYPKLTSQCTLDDLPGNPSSVLCRNL